MTKVSEMDSRFKYEISKISRAEKIMLSFQCGTCTADCPIARFGDSYRPRKLMYMTHAQVDATKLLDQLGL